MKLTKRSTAQLDAAASGRLLCLFFGCVSSLIGLIVLAYGFPGLRIGWNAASSLILFGMAVACFTGMRVLRDLDTRPLFSAAVRRTIVSGSIGAGLLVGLGGLIRWLLEDRIGAAAGIEAANTYHGPQFREWLWILDIPFLVPALTLMAIGAVWTRAQSLQSDAEGIV